MLSKKLKEKNYNNITLKKNVDTNKTQVSESQKMDLNQIQEAL
jgi:hypothetical protein